MKESLRQSGKRSSFQLFPSTSDLGYMYTSGSLGLGHQASHNLP